MSVGDNDANCSITNVKSANECYALTSTKDLNDESEN